MRRSPAQRRERTRAIQALGRPRKNNSTEYPDLRFRVTRRAFDALENIRQGLQQHVGSQYVVSKGRALELCVCSTQALMDPKRGPAILHRLAARKGPVTIDDLVDEVYRIESRGESAE